MAYAGSTAWAIDAICKKHFAPAMAKHGLLAFTWATHGGSGLPQKYLDVFENVRQQLVAQSALKLAEIPVDKVPTNKKDFHYIIMKDADKSFRTSPIAFGTKANFNSDDVSDRFKFSPKRMEERPAVFGEDEQQLSGTELIGSYFDVIVGQKIIKLINGLAYQYINGAGSGQDLTGILGLNPVSGTSNKNGFGQTTAGFASHTIGGLAVTASVNAELLPKQYPTAITTALTTPENLLKYVGYMVSYIQDPTPSGAIMFTSRDLFVTFQGVLRKANQNLLGIVHSSVGSGPMTILLGSHMLLDGIPMVIEDQTPDAHIFGVNLQTLGLRHKGKSFFRFSNIIDLAEQGYEIDSKGLVVGTSVQATTCMPTNIVVISAWDGT